MGLETEIWVSRLGFEGGAEKEKEKEKEEREKIPHVSESIGHRPLRAAALLPPQLQPQPT